MLFYDGAALSREKRLLAVVGLRVGQKGRNDVGYVERDMHVQ